MNREMEPGAGSTFLQTIVSHVREQVALRRAQTPTDQLVDGPLYELPRRGFFHSLAAQTRRCIIAEVKRASPSRGLIRGEFDPVTIARAYAANGATALSVVTEERFFQGSLQHLSAIRQTVSLPLLRKDFIVDPYQITEARSCGADAILLIAAILTRAQLSELHEQARVLSLDTLVEVHDDVELENALGAGVQLLGINNRDLHTFKVDLAVSERLLARVPAGVLAVCESGIGSVEDLERLERSGSHVFLIGETLMRAPSPGAKLAELLA
jgi:indole-3-glycerol phosphate synthase